MKRHLLYSFAVVGAAVIGALTLRGGDVSATSRTLNPGDDIAAAIAQATTGDTITFNPGTYVLDSYINLTGKDDITLRGNGNVVLRYNGAITSEAIRIFDSNDIWLEGLTVEATDTASEASFATASTGVAINSSCRINLQKVTVRNFGRSGVAVTRLNDGAAHDCPAGNITFNDLTSTNNKTGILFTNGAAAPVGDILNVQFTGTTTITGADYGVMKDSSSNLGAIKGMTGVDNGRLNFGSMNITTNQVEGMLYPIRIGTNPASISLDTTMYGVKVSAMNYKVFCDLVGAFVIPSGVCVEGVSQMQGFNCSCDINDPNNTDKPCLAPGECENCPPVPCDPNDPTDPNFPCTDMGAPGIDPTVPDTGFVTGTVELIKSNAVLLAGIGGGVAIGGVLVARWAKKLHRIRL